MGGGLTTSSSGYEVETLYRAGDAPYRAGDPPSGGGPGEGPGDRAAGVLLGVVAPGDALSKSSE